MGNVYDPGGPERGNRRRRRPGALQQRKRAQTPFTPRCSTTDGAADDAFPRMCRLITRISRPQNYNHDFSGAVPANRVIERSLNVPSVRMLDKYGRENFVAGAGAGFRHDRPQRRPLRLVADSGRRGDHALGPHGRLYADGGQTRRAGDDPQAALRRVEAVKTVGRTTFRCRGVRYG